MKAIQSIFSLILVVTIFNFGISQRPKNVNLSETKDNEIENTHFEKTINYLKQSTKAYRNGSYQKAIHLSFKACHVCDEIKSLNLTGISYSNLFRHKAAENRFNRAEYLCETEGRNPDTILYNHVLLNIKMKKFNEALEKFNKITNTNLPEYSFMKCYLLAKTGNISIAIASFEEYVLTHPKDFISFYNLSLLYFEQGDLNKSKFSALKANKIRNDWSCYIVLGNISLKEQDYSKAKQNFSKAYYIQPNNSICKLAYANMLNKEHETKQAIELYKSLVTNHAFVSNSFSGLGDCYYQNKDFLKATKYYKLSIKKDSTVDHPYIGLGNIELHKSELLKAKTYYDLALNLNSLHQYTYEKRAIVFFRMNNYTKAFEDFNKIIEINSDYKFSYDAYISKAYSEFNLRFYEKSVLTFQKAIIKDPAKATAYDGLGCSYFELSLYQEAANQLKKAVQIDPDNEVTLTNYGNALYQITEFELAQKQFAKAVLINPMNQHALNGIGICLYQENNYKQSIESLNHAISIDTSNADIYINRAVSRGHFLKELKELKERGAIDSVQLEYKLLVKDFKKYQIMKMDSSVFYINLGYLHIVWNNLDSARYYFNKVKNTNGFKFKYNNLGVTELLKTDIDKGQALELFAKAKLEVDGDKYYAPDINKTLMNSNKFNYVDSNDPWTRRHVARDKFLITYFYYSLMRYMPPVIDHDLDINIDTVNVDFKAHQINQLFYTDFGKCRMIKVYYPEAQNVTDLPYKRSGTGCPIF